MNLGKLIRKWKNRNLPSPKDNDFFVNKWCNDPSNAFYNRHDVWNKIDVMCETMSIDEVLKWSMKELGIKSHIFNQTTTETKKKVIKGNYPLSLLKDYPIYDNSTYAKQKMKQLNETLDNFFLAATVVNYKDSYSQISYDVKLQGKTSVQQIKNRKEDIRVNLDIDTIDFSNSNGYLNIIIPTKQKSIVGSKMVLEMASKNIPLGLSFDGNAVDFNLARDKHLIIGGSTGGGKTVLIHHIICSILFKYSPRQIKLFLADFKRVSLHKYNSIPHLLKPCITDENEFIQALTYIEEVIKERQEIFKQRDIEELPQDMERIVFAVDELGIVIQNKEIKEKLYMSLSEARAFGIHFILATQTPTKEIISTILRNNIPSRIALKVENSDISKVMINKSGAEELSGEGDMYFMDGKGNTTRLQGAYITNDEVLKVTKALEGETNYIKAEVKKDLDKLFYEFGKFCINEGRASEQLFRDTYIDNYSRANKIIKQLRDEGVISEYDSSERKSHILMTLEDFEREYGNETS